MHLTRRGAALGLLGLAGTLSSGPAWSQAATVPRDGDVAPTQIASGRDRYRHMLAPVEINRQGPFSFLIDTGANVSCVSAGLAERLRLAPAPPAQVHTAVGVVERASVILERLQIGSRKRSGVQAAVLSTLGPGIDGLLGVDWLTGERLVLDFKNKSLAITRSEADRTGLNRVVVPARRRHGQLTIVDAELSGRPISAMIDSGAQATLCNAPLRRLVESIERRRPPAAPHEIVRLESLAGEPFAGELLYLPFLRLGGLTLGNVPIVSADTYIFELWGLKNEPALVLGMDLLTEFDSVALDYGRSQVRFDLA